MNQEYVLLNIYYYISFYQLYTNKLQYANIIEINTMKLILNL